jgi:hypothetical protein
MNAAPLFRWSVFAWGGVGFLLLGAFPEVPLEGLGNPRLPVLVHAFTLGVFVNGYYGLQWQAWRPLYRREPPWPPLAAGIWALHQMGVALMLGGFLFAGLGVALWGAHYLVPGGILLHTMQAAAATWRRGPGAPRQLGAHAPLLGLLATMALGAMIVLDEVTGRYGMFNPPTLLLHAAAGAFLFLYPALELAARLRGLSNGGPQATQPVTTRLLLQTLPPAVGVLLLAVGLAGEGRIALPAGLGLLGAALLWGALPGAGGARGDAPAAARMAWAVPALLLLYAAIRALRGMPPQEAHALANLGAVSVLLIAALPALMAQLAPAAGTVPRRAALGIAALAVAGLLTLAGQVTGEPGLVQLAAPLGLGGLAVLALPGRSAAGGAAQAG